MIEKETSEYNKIQELLKDKQKSGKWDITCVVQDENGNLQNFNVINLIVDYANAMEELTDQKVRAFDIAQRLLTLDTFRFENFKKGIDDHLLYNAPVTSQEYLDRRGQENRGAENLGQFNSNGDYEYAIAIFKNGGEEYLKRDEGIYAVLVHEFTHYLATHYIQDEKYIKEFMEQNPEVFISTDNQLSAYDENGECKPLTRYDVFSGVSRKNGKEFFDIQLGVEKDEEGNPIRDENGNLKVKGILHEQLNSYQREEENSRRITHTRLTEGFTEHIAHLLLEKIYGKSFRELPFEQDKYAAEVSMAELYFKQKDVGDAVYEYITNPQQIIAELEDIETKDGNDLFHETTRYLNLNHNIGLMVQNIMAMNTKFQSIITGEPTTQEDIDNIANGTADIIESDFKDQKYQIINEEKIIEILKKETSIERLKALIDFQKQNDSPQIQYLILKEIGPALQEFYNEKNMIYSLYENLKTQTKEEKMENNAIPKKLTNQDVEEMIAGIKFNYILREGLCGADLSECDMSELDFEHFKLLCYDENTHFSDQQIKRFNPLKLLEIAKLPMESLREVHSKGINASGVKVAIIDTNIEQNKIRDLNGGRVEYVESQYEGEIEPHGATVLDSFMQIAPNAEVQYYPLDKKDKVNKANHLFEYIKQATQSGVKIISLSNDLANIMGDRIDEVRDYLDTNGVTLIDSPTFYSDFTYCFRDIQFDGAETYKESLCEPEDLSHRNFWNKIVSMYQSKLKEYNVSNIEDLKKQLEEKGDTELLRRIIEFEPILQFEEFSEGKNSPLHFLKQREKSNELSKRNNNVEVPCGGRTLDGKYWGTSSASYTIPVIAGMFAMCKQINPQIKYEDFVALCKETSQIIDGCNLIQPQILMDKVREKVTNIQKLSQAEIDKRKESEAVSFFHDQKSDEFFEDEQGQRRYIVPAQVIGKATVNTPIEQKQEAERVGARNMKDVEQVKEVDDVTKISIDEKEG